MDSQNQTSQKIPSIRTYAKDLEYTRGGKDPSTLAATEGKPLPPPTTNISELQLPKIKHFVVPQKRPVEKPSVARTTEVETKIFVADPPPEVKEDTIQTRPLPPLSSLGYRKTNLPKISDLEPGSTTFIVDNEDAATATIITDTKRDRFKLIPSIISSLKSWFTLKKLSYKTKKIPKYTIPASTHRKGVIQKATSKTGKINTADFSSIHERIRQRKEEDQPAPQPAVLPSPEVAKPDSISNVQIVNKKSFRHNNQDLTLPEPSEAVKVLPPATIPKTSSELPPPKPEVVIKETPQLVLPEEATQEEKVWPIIPPTPDEKKVAPEGEPAPLENTILAPEEAPKTKNSLLLINTNTLTLIISAIIIALVIAITYTYFLLVPTEEAISTSPTTSVSLITDIPVTLIAGETNTKEDILEILQTSLYQKDELTQLALIYSDSLAKVIPPQILLDILEVVPNVNFSTLISDIRFGYTKTKSPFILMKTTNKAEAFGSIIAWEKSMYADVSKIMGTSVQPETAKLKFLDASLAGTDVRVLKSATGENYLLYGFQKNIVIITTDTATYTELLKLIP